MKVIDGGGVLEGGRTSCRFVDATRPRCSRSSSIRGTAENGCRGLPLGLKKRRPSK